MNLFELFFKISAEDEASETISKLSEGVKGFAKATGTAVAGVAAGTIALGKKFVSGVSDIASYGDAIDKNSQKMGISAKAYQEWDFILQHNGTSISSLSRSMMTLSRKAENNADSFAKLGITEEELATLNKEELFERTIEGLQSMGEGTERDSLAMELLGGAAKELGPLLNSSAEDVAEMKKQVNELGGVMDDVSVKNAAAFQDALQNMQTALDGVKRSFLSNFLPSFTKVIDGLTAIFSGDSGGVNKINEGIGEIVDSLSAKIPEFIEVGFSIIEGLITAINENLPMLIEKGADILLNGVIPGIIENLPMLIETAFSIIAQLVSSIGEALPELIPAAVNMIIQIVESLLDNIDLLIDGAIALVIGLAEGLITAIPILIEKAPTIVIKLVEAIIRNAPKLLKAAVELIVKLVEGIGSALNSIFVAGKEIVSKIWEGIKSLWSSVSTWGKQIIDKVWSGLSGAISSAVQWGADLITNFWNGIKSKLSWLWDGVKGIAGGIADFLGFSEPKKGPLSNFHTFAPDMMELFMKGINDNKDKLTDTVANTFDFQNLINGPSYNVGSSLLSETGNTGEKPIYIVLDSGELVGKTASKYDKALGIENAMTLRWEGAMA